MHYFVIKISLLSNSSFINFFIPKKLKKKKKPVYLSACLSSPLPENLPFLKTTHL